MATNNNSSADEIEQATNSSWTSGNECSDSDHSDLLVKGTCKKDGNQAFSVSLKAVEEIRRRLANGNLKDYNIKIEVMPFLDPALGIVPQVNLRTFKTDERKNPQTSQLNRRSASTNKARSDATLPKIKSSPRVNVNRQHSLSPSESYHTRSSPSNIQATSSTCEFPGSPFYRPVDTDINKYTNGAKSVKVRNLSGTRGERLSDMENATLFDDSKNSNRPPVHIDHRNVRQVQRGRKVEVDREAAIKQKMAQRAAHLSSRSNTSYLSEDSSFKNFDKNFAKRNNKAKMTQPRNATSRQRSMSSSVTQLTADSEQE